MKIFGRQLVAPVCQHVGFRYAEGGCEGLPGVVRGRRRGKRGSWVLARGASAQNIRRRDNGVREGNKMGQGLLFGFLRGARPPGGRQLVGRTGQRSTHTGHLSRREEVPCVRIVPSGEGTSILLSTGITVKTIMFVTIM